MRAEARGGSSLQGVLRTAERSGETPSPPLERPGRFGEPYASALDSLRTSARAGCTRLAALPLPLQYLLFFAAVALGHLTLLHLPYYWDEAGYYVPAALDFFRRGTLIPEYTNAHPPLPSLVLGTVWHATGFHILATRLTACAFAAGALLALYRLAGRLLAPAPALAVAQLTAVYPIWYVQSTLAHGDIFAAAFVLAALALYLPHPESAPPRAVLWTSLLFSLAALSKETAIVWPATLAALELFRAFRSPQAATRRNHLRWFASMCTPLLPLLAWFGYHRWKTGFTFGNPEYLRYNATANLTAGHILQAVRFRFLHLFTQRGMWLALLLAAACLLLNRRAQKSRLPLPRTVLSTMAILVCANWLFFSVLGGALLTRYLLPVYALLLLFCVAAWRQTQPRQWPWLGALTASAFVSAWWLSPPTSFAPEDCLLYRDMIVTHQEAIAYIDQYLPGATVLTAWPAAGELTRPELGYTDRLVKVAGIDNFTAGEVAKAAAQPLRYDTALVVATRFTEPVRRRWLLDHPDSRRGRAFAAERELDPEEVAAALGGSIVFQDERNGEWAAVLRFPRR